MKRKNIIVAIIEIVREGASQNTNNVQSKLKLPATERILVLDVGNPIIKLKQSYEGEKDMWLQRKVWTFCKTQRIS